MKAIYTLMFCSFLVFSCGKSENAELESLNKELMKGHDDVMPVSMKIGDLKKQILEANASAPDSIKVRVDSVSNRLQKAEDDMYSWMERYGKAMNDIKDENQKLEAYKKLNEEIKVIKNETDLAISEGNALIKK